MFESSAYELGVCGQGPRVKGLGFTFSRYLRDLRMSFGCSLSSSTMSASAIHSWGARRGGRGLSQGLCVWAGGVASVRGFVYGRGAGPGALCVGEERQQL